MPEPLTLAEDVRPEWIDYNGHLSEAYYVLVFGHATDAVMVALGHDAGVPGRDGTSLYTLEAHVRYLDQVPPGARARGALVGDRRDRQAAVALARDVVPRTGCGRPRRCSWCTSTPPRARASPFPDDLRARAEALLVPPPEHASRRIAVG